MYELKKSSTIAEEENSHMCQANGCPNRWTVDKGQRLCSAHAWADPRDWDKISGIEWTAYRNRGDRNNYQAMSVNIKVPARKVSEFEKRQIINNLRNLMREKRHA